MRLWPSFALLALAALSPGRARAHALTPPVYPLSVSADGRHLVDQSGQVVFFHADSPWHLLPRVTQADALLFLDDRQQKGFNAALMSLVVRDGFPGGGGTNAYGAAPFLVPNDFATPNEAYFQQVDWVLQQAHQRGFTIFLFPAFVGYACDWEGWCQVMKQNGVAKMRDWGRWVGNRYKNQPNLVWAQGGDVDAAFYGALDEVDAVAEGILEVDPNHLHTAHCNRFNSGIDCYNRPWLDFNTTYGDCLKTPRELRTDYDRVPAMPTVYIEGRYEYERDWTDRCLRSQAYWSMLGGAFGHFWGSGKIWDFVPGWRTALGSVGSVGMDYFGRLLRSRPWELLVPDYAHTVLTAGYGDLDTVDYAGAARASNGSTVIVYTPTQRALTIAMNQIAGGTAVAWWFDPATAVATAAGTFPTTGTRQFTPPTASDWVLVLDSQAVGFQPPGVGDWETVDVEAPASRPMFVLEQSHPNPFNPSTTIRYRLHVRSHVVLKVYNTAGAELVTLLDRAEEPGPREVAFTAAGLGSGTYFYRIVVQPLDATVRGEQSQTRRFTLLK